MTIDQAKKFLDYVMNKKQNNYLSGDDFNFLAPIAQMSVLNDRLGNVKKYLPGAPVPPYGFSINQKSREELRPLMKKPTVTAVAAGVASYPADYLYYDAIDVNGGNFTRAMPPISAAIAK